MKLTDIEFVKVDPIRNIKRMVSLKSAAQRIREHNRIHYATERNSPIITEILESCARLLEDIDAGKVKCVEYGEWIDAHESLQGAYDSYPIFRCSKFLDARPFSSKRLPSMV